MDSPNVGSIIVGVASGNTPQKRFSAEVAEEGAVVAEVITRLNATLASSACSPAPFAPKNCREGAPPLSLQLAPHAAIRARMARAQYTAVEKHACSR
jgi:hypothetical protein